MQLTIAQSALARELALVAPLASKRSTIPILEHVRITAGPDGITLTGTDLERALTTRVPCAVAAEGAICLPATRLLNLVRSLAGEISLSTDDKGYVTIRAGRSRTRIAGMGAESFPELPVTPEPVATLDARAFARQLARVVYAISSEESRFTLNGALVEIASAVVRCVATDGHRLAWTESEGTAGADTQFLMHKVAIQHYAKLADQAEGGARVEISTDEGHLFFTIGSRVLVARKLTGNFPDYKRVLPDHSSHITVDRAALAGAVDRVAQFADERSRAVRFAFASGEIGLTGQSVEVGESEESVPCEGAIVVVAGFNAAYVAESLKAISHERVAIFLRDGKSAAEIRPMRGAGTEQDPYAVDADYRVVLMPMRI